MSREKNSPYLVQNKICGIQPTFVYVQPWLLRRAANSQARNTSYFHLSWSVPFLRLLSEYSFLLLKIVLSETYSLSLILVMRGRPRVALEPWHVFRCSWA